MLDIEEWLSSGSYDFAENLHLFLCKIKTALCHEAVFENFNEEIADQLIFSEEIICVFLIIVQMRINLYEHFLRAPHELGSFLCAHPAGLHAVIIKHGSKIMTEYV